jgi:putative two-component system response regulator
LQPCLDGIRHHHEKLDGSGYPDGLKGAEISLEARILCVADIFDALYSDRPYRSKIPLGKVREIMTADADAGKLDTHIVDLLFKMVENGELNQIMEDYQ